MNETLLSLLKDGEQMLVVLEKETTACLLHLESLSEDEFERFVQQRQQHAAGVEKIVVKLGTMKKCNGLTDSEDFLRVESFKQIFESALKRILDADRLISALAELRKVALQAELDEIFQGRRAVKGYRRKTQQTNPSLDQIA